MADLVSRRPVAADGGSHDGGGTAFVTVIGDRTADVSDTGRRAEREAAAALPVARVAVDVPLTHLDRAFDYLVPADADETARPGCRVRVRFAGQLRDGFL